VQDPTWTLDKQTGLMAGVTCLCSPHCDDRPGDGEVSAIVIHAISLPPRSFSTEAIHDLFLGCLDVTRHPYFQTIPSTKVSAHFLIDREGKLSQFVPVTRRAWHAGVSELQGRDRVNDFSIGIELVGSDEDPFTEQQYSALAALTKILCTAFPAITADRIVGHSDIAPGRKTDPGPFFRWARFKSNLLKP